MNAPTMLHDVSRRAFLQRTAALGMAGVAAPFVTSLGAIGEAAAARLVERCIKVSPATHPPCHADNPCALIRGEIDRSCKLWDKDPPAECRSFPSGRERAP